MLKGLWERLTGGAGAGASATASEPVEHNGYRINATPFAEAGQFQTSGVITKEIDGVTKEHRFIRAEKHPSREDAESFSIAKAKQIIEQQGDRMFGP